MEKKIESKEDFILFLESHLDNLKNHPNEWENNTLPDYLEALISWTEDMDGYYINNNLPIPKNVNWKVFADILMAAKIYE